MLVAIDAIVIANAKGLDEMLVTELNWKELKCALQIIPLDHKPGVIRSLL